MKQKVLYPTTALLFFALLSMLLTGCNTTVTEQAETSESAQPEVISSSVVKAEHDPFPGEEHFSVIKQLTDGGENAEAYFSQDGTKLIFQSTREEWKCDQIFMMDLKNGGVKLVSTGKGRTTCSFISPDNSFITYASTHEVSEDCPKPPETGRGGYAWILYDYDIFRAGMDGSNPVNITNSPGYDAEGVISPDGKRMVFSSTRSGDQEIYMMDIDGSNVRQLTFELGYDGGPFYSWDGSKIVYRSSRPKTEEDIAAYKQAISQGMMLRVPLEIYVMDGDGNNSKQVTELGAASFAPFMHPDGKRIIFCSNYGDNPRIFNLWMVNVDGTGLEQITHNESFDGFPMFSKDGKYLVFCSNRYNSGQGNTNVFITEWID